jgi:hypothetical protein
MRSFFIDLNLILLFCIINSSCNTKKKYYYIEDGNDKTLIEAYSDSAAYMKAFENFEISKKVYNDMKESLKSISIEEPVSFELLNEKKIDIRYTTTFVGKDSFENACAKNISQSPNTIEEAVVKNREEQNGIGAKYDTGGLYLAPIKVLSAKFVNKEYSNYKDVSLSFKNVTNKKISAIRFKWYGENSFNEPADMGSLKEGWGAGFTDDALRAGASSNSTWEVLSRDGKKILIAYPYEVAFDDGTKWALNP